MKKTTPADVRKIYDTCDKLVYQFTEFSGTHHEHEDSHPHAMISFTRDIVTNENEENESWTEDRAEVCDGKVKIRAGEWSAAEVAMMQAIAGIYPLYRQFNDTDAKCD